MSEINYIYRADDGWVLRSDALSAISDISGQDIRSHRGEPNVAIPEIRDWLQAASRRRNLPGGGEVAARFQRFSADLPAICAGSALAPDRLTFLDLSGAIADWLRINV